MTGAVSAVAASLTEIERATIQRRGGPQNKGAEAADILDMADNADACLAWTEPFYERDGDVERLHARLDLAGDISADDATTLIRLSVMAAAVLASDVPTVSVVERILSGAIGEYRVRAAGAGR